MTEASWAWARATGASARGLVHLAIRDDVFGLLTVTCGNGGRPLRVGFNAVTVAQEDVLRFRPCLACQRRAKAIIAELDSHIAEHATK